MFPIRPNEDRVIIKPETLADQTKGGLWIPDIAKGNPKQGEVMRVGVGSACKHCGLPKPIEIEVGDKVIFPDSAGTEIEYDGEKYLIIRSMDIQGIV